MSSSFNNKDFEITDNGVLHYIGKSNKPSQPLGLKDQDNELFCAYDNQLWDISNITDYSGLFSDSDLEELDLSSWTMMDIDCENIYDMFSKKLKLLKIDFSKWNYKTLSQFCYDELNNGFEFIILNTDKDSNLELCPKKVGYYYYDKDQYKINNYIPHPLHYRGKSNKPTQPIGLRYYHHMFSIICYLKIIDLSDWDMSRDDFDIEKFIESTSVEEIIINKNNCSDKFIDYVTKCSFKVTDISEVKEEVNTRIKIATINNNIVYYGVDSYEIGLDGYLKYIGNTNKPTQPIGLTNYDYIFAFRDDLKSLDLSHWDMHDMDTEDVYKMFNIHLDILNIDFSKWNYKCLSQFFYDKIKFLIVNTDKNSNLKFISISKRGNVYYNKDQYSSDLLGNLRYIGNSNKPDQPIGIKYYSYMFSSRDDLEIIDLSDWDLSKVEEMNSMFGNKNIKEIIINTDKCSDMFINHASRYGFKIIDILEVDTKSNKKEEEISNMKKNDIGSVAPEKVEILRLEDIEYITNTRKVDTYNKAFINNNNYGVIDMPKNNKVISVNDIVIIKYCKLYRKNIYELLAMKITGGVAKTISSIGPIDSVVRKLLKVVKVVEVIDDDNFIVEDLSSDDKICDGKFIISKSDIDDRYSYFTNRLIDSTKELLDLLESIGSNMNIEVVNFVKDKYITTQIVNIACSGINEDIYINCDCLDFGDFTYTDDLIKAIKDNKIGVSTLIKFEGVAYEILSVEINTDRNTVTIYSKNKPVFLQ